MLRTRFAPSPTGPLHLGHAYSATLAWRMARDATGSFLLRMEDIDRARSKSAWEGQILDDLAWLGLDWAQPVTRQSDNKDRYGSALDRLTDMGVVYPCTCTRRDIQEALSAPQEGAKPTLGPDGPVYPGTCRGAVRPPTETRGAALRLDMARALERIFLQHLTPRLSFDELTYEGGRRFTLDPVYARARIGDVVIARRDMGTSYHLSVVVDDAAQGITHVVRGEDLFEATFIHVVLQILLNLPTPVYAHHALIRDAAGKRLAKRDDARAIATYRAQGLGPSDVLALVGLA